MHRPKILLVEEKADHAERIRDRLKRLGFDTVSIADSSHAAGKIAASESPDLLMVDTFLRGEKRGIETAREIRSLRDLPVIYFDGKAPEEEPASLILTDGESYITQLFTGEGLREAVEKTLLNHDLDKKSSESTARFEKIFECSQDAIFIFCPRSNQIKEVNPKACEMFGYPRKALLAKMVHEIHPNQETALGAFVQSVYREGTGWTDQLTGQKEDGTVLSLEISASLICLKGSLCILAMKRDITQRKRDEAALRESETKYRTLVEAANAAIFIFQGENLLYVNHTAEVTSGYSREELLSMPFWGILHPDDQAIAKSRGFSRQRGEGIPRRYEVKIARKNGEIRWVDFNASLMEYKGQSAVLGIGHDITDRKRMEEKLKLAQFTLDRSATPIFMTASDAQFFYVNDAACRKLGYSRGELLSMRVHDIDPDFPVENWVETWEKFKKKGSLLTEAHHKTKTGKVFPVEIRANFLSFDGREYNCVFAQDITDREAIKQKLEYQAYHDSLTGLVNRNLFSEHLIQAIKQTRRNNQKVSALLFVDLDQFKQINDTFGHSVGDEVLKETAARLLAVVRESDTVARLSGDEFLVLLSDITDRTDIVTVAKKIIETLSVFQWREQVLCLGASIGIVVTPDDGNTATDLLKRADMAMYKAKQRGRNRYHFFNQRLEQRVQEKNHLEWDLRRAITKGELTLHYQSIFDIDTLRMVSIEALIRWRHPQKGLILPNSFIPIAERSDLICEIGEWVLKTSCNQMQIWREQNLFQGTLSVNLSGRQFSCGCLQDNLGKILSEYGLPATVLILEIPESLILKPGVDAVRKLEDFRALGIQVSVDDFGTGCSSLSYLSEFPVDHLKIDQSFVNGITADRKKRSLVEAIIRMGESLNLTTIAEGIETEEALTCLKNLGCKMGQGFYFGEPLPAEAVVFSAGTTGQ